MVREMRPEDARDVFAIEQFSFSDPWSFESIREGLGNSLDTWLILEEEAKVIGYCVFRIIAVEGELLRIAVLPEYRGRGLSKKLMDQMVEYARKMEAVSMSLEVREGNKRARNLYKSYGFTEESIRKNYYRDPCEDAIMMWNRGI